MELWIRSQDKEKLIKVSNVKYTYRKGDLYSDVRGNHYIGTYYDNLAILGEYTTKERAIEILDEIQNILSLKYILDSSSIKPAGNFYEENGVIFQKYNANAEIKELSTFVYQMPEK